MKWCLLRKPFPGLTKEERVDLLPDEMIFGRGKECNVHCLSMYVSRRHLKLVLREDSVYVMDLGSSNGTFVNETKITPQVEVPLGVDDELGIGNIEVENKDCYVYKVCFCDDEGQRVISLPGPSDIQKLQVEDGHQVEGEDMLKEKPRATENSLPNKCLDVRGLKRSASEEPDIVILDDDDDDDINIDSSSVPKKPRIGLETDDVVEPPVGTVLNSINEPLLMMNPIQLDEDSHMKEQNNDKKCSKSIFTDSVKENCMDTDDISSNARIPNSEEKEMPITCNYPSDGNSSGQKCGIMLPPCSTASITPQQRFNKGSFSKSRDSVSSLLLENTTDSTEGTLKLSSPLQLHTLKSISTSSSCSTPIASKIISSLATKPVLTSTPCNVKGESRGPFKLKSESEMSPIVKDSSRQDMSSIVKDSFRHSHESSANYTLEEEMIALSDSEDEIFPCSQMFTEEDVQPSNDKNKEAEVVDLSGEEELDICKKEREEELDDVVLISSDEDDEDDIFVASQWFQRLSQSFVKTEPEESKNPVQHSQQSDLIDAGHFLGDEDILGDEADSALLPDPQDCIDDSLLNRLGEQVIDSDEKIVESDILLERKKETNKLKLEELKLEQLKLEETEKSIQSIKEAQMARQIELDAAKAAEAVKKSDQKVIKEKDKRVEREKEKVKDKHRHHKRKEKSTENDKARHRRHDSKKKEREVKESLVQKLKDEFGEDSSDEGSSKDSHHRTEKLPEFKHKDKQKNSDDASPPDKFDLLLKSYNESNNLKLKEKEVHVSLERLEDSHPEWSDRIKYPLSDMPCSSRQTAPSKKTRKIELVEALPNPPRRAINRGISEDTIFKTSGSDKSTRALDSKDDKLSDPKDPKALRKEKLAKVAAQQASKDKANAETKRGAPAKVKITKSNRGNFLAESDDSSSSRKPKSRKDIIDNIKIPKLSGKPVNVLPTKSPLQEMNMSWEKEVPKVNEPPAPAPTPSVPVEIPTGPQPKKRIAQVPRPGFFDDGSSLQAPASSAELKSRLMPSKSCLLGSSKHNIALNNSIVTPQKKRVRFKESIVEVRYIERCENARSVSSMKDADRLRPKPLGNISKPTTHMGQVRPSDDNLLQDVLYDICKWNPLWLKEEKKLPSDVLPPVVSNMNLPTIPKTEFLDYEEYHETMYPLLMLELWNGVSKEYSINHGDSRGSLFMAVDSAHTAPVPCSAVQSRPSDLPRMLATLNCHMLVDEKNQCDLPRLGNLVIIDLGLVDPAGKRIVNPVFGYVSYDCKDRLQKQDQVHKDLINVCRKPVFKIRFSLYIRERRNFQFVFDKPMRVKSVKYIRGDLRQFQAMKNLKYTPLKNSVISPAAANEDFTLPDVSRKTLAFPDQLNPTQQKVVLQTAEVCLQDVPKICLIQGPPGTGKSHIIASLVVQLLYRDGLYSKKNRENGMVPRILLCAPSNNAIDILVRRLLRKRAALEKIHRFKMVRVGQDNVMHPDVKGVSLKELSDAILKVQAANVPHNTGVEKTTWSAKLCCIENQIRELIEIKKPVPPELESRKADILRRLRVLDDRQKQQEQNAHSNSRHTAASEREAMKKILRGADIVATTLSSCVVKNMETNFPLLSENDYHFQVCVVDEATQCLEVETLIPLLLKVKTLVLVGDPNQLPATVLSKAAKDRGLGNSLFARLQRTIPHAVQLLDTQYRMHPEILKWPNLYFYNRRLKTREAMSSCRSSKIVPYALLSLPFSQDPRGETNHDEATFVVQLAQLLIEKEAIPLQNFLVGIITPYQSQRRLIHAMLQERPCRDVVEVNTIDSCQGQEKDFIIMSCVRTSGVGFLSDRQRINVALTRAKYALMICGNFSSLDRDSMWNNLLNDGRQRGCFINIRGHLQNEDLWNYLKRQ